MNSDDIWSALGAVVTSGIQYPIGSLCMVKKMLTKLGFLLMVNVTINIINMAYMTWILWICEKTTGIGCSPKGALMG